ncbi:MAG: RidA family protein [Verrucomicrobiota bacterium]|nr:RidA family protein [Verrucomicrobiota bacterium]
MNATAKLLELGLTLPPPPAPAGNYLPFVRAGNLLYTAGTLPIKDGALAAVGKVGSDVTIEQGYEAARLCALNILAIITAAAGSLDQVERFVAVTGFVNATGDFAAHPKVINGASDLFAAVFGDAGKHARVAVGASSLPLNAAVEVQAVVLLKS